MNFMKELTIPGILTLYVTPVISLNNIYTLLTKENLRKCSKLSSLLADLTLLSIKIQTNLRKALLMIL